MRFNLPLSVYQRLPSKVRVGWLYGVDLRMGRLTLHIGLRPFDPMPSCIQWHHANKATQCTNGMVTLKQLTRHPVMAIRYLRGEVWIIDWQVFLRHGHKPLYRMVDGKPVRK